MGRYFRPALGLALALFMRPGPSPGPAAMSMPPTVPADEPWYTPRPEDFRPSYDRDLANGGKQTWDQYWSWVGTFYEGKFFTKGWNDRARWLVEKAHSDGERRRLRARLNALGRDICAEWAKDYDVRKVGSADLVAWGKMLERARGEDDGTGEALHRAIDEIRARHRRKVVGSPH